MAGGISPRIKSTDQLAGHFRQINQRIATLERAASTSGGGGGGGGGGLIAIPTTRTLTASGTWTKPPGLVYAVAEVQAGGGAGGGAPTSVAGSTAFGTSGGAGGYARKVYMANELAASIAYTVGAAGVGVSGANGGNGGNSTFMGITASGGTGGVSHAAGVNTAPRTLFGGVAGTATGGDVNVKGGNGGPVHHTGGGSIGGDMGGGQSFFGGGGAFALENNGGASVSYGAGGGGMRNNGAVAARVGGTGGAGVILVTEWVVSEAADGIPVDVADARYVNVDGDSMVGALLMASPAALNFQDTPLSQRINLYYPATSFGIGIQASTHYVRSSSDFAWHKGGVHSDVRSDPGAGGTLNMLLDANGSLYLPNRAGGINMNLGASASSGPRLRMHLPASGEVAYIDFEGTTLNAGDLMFRSGTTSVMQLEQTVIRPMKPVYATGQFRVAGSVQSVLVIDPGNGPYYGMYDGTTPDSIGTRKGYMGFSSASTLAISNEVASGAIQIRGQAAGTFIDFYTAGVFEARMDAAGHFCVGKSSTATATLGGAMLGTGRITSTTADGVEYCLITNIPAATSGGVQCNFRRSDTSIGSITVTAALTAVAYNTTSDKRTKGNIADFDADEAIKLVKRLRPRTFQWRYDDDGEPSPDGEPSGPVEVSFVAQELAKVVPDAVRPGKGNWAAHLRWKAKVAAYIEAHERYEEWRAKDLVEERETRGPEPRLPVDPGDDPYEPWMNDNSKLVPRLTAALLGVIRRVERQDDELVELRRLLSAR